jgi:hypothetical protein
VRGDLGDGRILTAGGDIGSITIGGSIIGGEFAGTIECNGDLGAVKIGGSILGVSSDDEASIRARSIGSVTILGDLRGASIGGTESDLRLSGAILSFTRIGRVFIGGSIMAGTDASTGGSLVGNAGIIAGDDIGSITVRGSVIGSVSTDGDSGDGKFTPVIIAARGKSGLSDSATSDLAIGKIAIGGRIDLANILAGYTTASAGNFLRPVNADARVGTVTVGGDWIASNLIVGVQDKTSDGFGDADDTKIFDPGSGFTLKDNDDDLGAVSRIESVIIKGQAIGTIASNDTEIFGIEAQQIVSIKIGDAAIPFITGASNDLFATRRPLGPSFSAGGIFDLNAFEFP